jgi:hypothetical protein
MKVLVCGSRDWDHRDDPAVIGYLSGFQDALRLMERWGAVTASGKGVEPITILIHGDATGVDRLAGAWAIRHLGSEHVRVYPAHWQHTPQCAPDCPRQIGVVAGPIRNQQMLTERPEVVIAFPGGRGTADVVGRAQHAQIEVVRAL